MAQVEDEGTFQPGKLPDRVGDVVRIRRVNFAVDAQDGAQAARKNVQPRAIEVGHVPAAFGLAGTS